jgi:hypothetical protein
MTALAQRLPPYLYIQTAQLSNNEWNRLVGLNWRALSDAQQRPYKILAAHDKTRYDAVQLAIFCEVFCALCPSRGLLILVERPVHTTFAVVLDVLNLERAVHHELKLPFLSIHVATGVHSCWHQRGGPQAQVKHIDTATWHKYSVTSPVPYLRQTAYNCFVHQVLLALPCSMTMCSTLCADLLHYH